MKKMYKKPEVRIENFIVDIAFAGQCQNQLSASKEDYRQKWDNNLIEHAGWSSFDEYWNSLQADDPNSGNCYFTVRNAAFS